MPFSVEKFRNLVEKTGQPAYKLAAAVGQPQGTISKLMSPTEHNNPRLSTLEAYARLFGCPVQAMLDPVAEAEPAPQPASSAKKKRLEIRHSTKSPLTPTLSRRTGRGGQD